MMKIARLLFILCCFCINVTYALDQSSQTLEKNHNPVKVDISHDKNIIYLRLKIDDDWVLYSNQLGDVGYQMSLDQVSSENLQSFDIIFPESQEMIDESGGIKNIYYVYKKEAVVKIEINPIDSAKETKIKMDFKYGVCKELCHLFENDIEYTVPALNDNLGHNSDNIILMIILAVIGGIILNVMPCCLPVLSIKILSLLKCNNQSEIKINALWTIIGIITSFLILAVAVVLLKSFGHAVGWGMHFQEPVFLMAIIMVITFFAINLWGVFEIELPGAAINKIATTSYYSQAMSSFFTGVTATLLATPCSAPFLSSSVAFALTQSDLMICMIYLAMGFGMSMPYTMLLINPKLAKLLPKPGAWMGTIKKLFAILLLVTACWLLHILSYHFGIVNIILFVGSLIFLSVILIITRPLQKTVMLVVMLIAVATIIYLPKINQVSDSLQIQESIWQDFDQAKLDSYVEEGRTVFVDVTAQWCMTCKYNKLKVLEKPEFIKLIEENDVVLMRANYTLKSQDINAFMARHKRSGVPLNVVYGKNKKDGIVLSETLAFEKIAAAIALASS